MSVNKEFADIVHFSLFDVDEKGDAIIFQESEDDKVTRILQTNDHQCVSIGYMIISSTFMYYDDEDEDGNEEF